MDLKQENLMFRSSGGCSALRLLWPAKPSDGHWIEDLSKITVWSGSFLAGPCGGHCFHFTKLREQDGWWNFKMCSMDHQCVGSHSQAGCSCITQVGTCCQACHSQRQYLAKQNPRASAPRIQIFEIWAWHGTGIKALIFERCFLLEHILGKWFCVCI